MVSLPLSASRVSIGVVADTHGPLRPEVVEDLKGRQAMLLLGRRYRLPYPRRPSNSLKASRRDSLLSRGLTAGSIIPKYARASLITAAGAPA